MALLHKIARRCLRTVFVGAGALMGSLVVVPRGPTDAAAPPAPARLALGPVEGMGPHLGVGPDGLRRASGPEEGSTGLVYRDGRFRPLAGVPGAALTAHTGINDRGVVAGSYLDADGVTTHGFLRSRAGRLVTIDVRGASATIAFDVDNRGDVAGSYLDVHGIAHAFVRAAEGTVTELDVPGAEQAAAFALNDRGQVVGVAIHARGRNEGFVWEQGRFKSIEVPGAEETAVLAINDRGQVVGDYLDAGATRNPDGTYPPNTVHGFVWDDGEVVSFDVPGSTLTTALGINDRGVVSGGYVDAQGRQHGFLFADGRFTSFDAPGRALTNGWGINNRGEVVIPDPVASALKGVSV